MRKLLTLVWVGLGLLAVSSVDRAWALAPSSYSESSPDTDNDIEGTNVYSGTPSSIFSRARVRAVLTSSGFQNNSLGIAGERLSAEAVAHWPGQLEVAARVPWLTGRVRERNQQEMGNPEAELKLKALSWQSNLDSWLVAVGRPANRGAQALISAHHDTWGGGIETRGDWGRWSGSLGLLYYLRSGEEQSKYDVGDLSHVSLEGQYRFHRRVSGRLGLNHYRVGASHLGRWTVTRQGEWDSIKPTVGYLLGEGLSVQAGLSVPFGLTTSSDELEAGVNDILFASPAAVGWTLGLGAVF